MQCSSSLFFSQCLHSAQAGIYDRYLDKILGAAAFARPLLPGLKPIYGGSIVITGSMGFGLSTYRPQCLALGLADAGQ